MNSEAVRQYTDGEIARSIDHAILKPDQTLKDVVSGCAIAARHQVFSVCVKPSFIEAAVRELRDSPVLIGTVIGFPHGGQTVEAKVAEASDAIVKGAAELDMVLNIGALKSGRLDTVRREIHGVREASRNLCLKVILETALLSDEEITQACRIADEAGAEFVKTSTGFAAHGATVDHVRLMKNSVGPRVQVKASGGIRSRQDAVAMLQAGATRLGTTATEAILKETASNAVGAREAY